MMNALEKILEEIEKQSELAHEEIRRCASENPLQFDEAKGYARGVEYTTEIIRFHMDEAENDGWIPVEDGLPEEGEEVEVTIEEMADSAGGMKYYTKTAWVQEERWVIKRNPYNPRVIAWRPLPKPYKPKKDLPAAGNEHVMSRFMKVE